jgi:ABC-type glycerol-3-phosphate transport system substrate-binding protein
VRRLTIALVMIAALALAACGGSETKTTADPFPPVEERGGRAYADAKSQNDAVRICVQALTEWPEAYSAYDRVTFRVPGPGRDYVCSRQQ